jgi:hypothetical protein
VIIPADIEVTIIRAVRGWFPDATVSTDIPHGWDWTTPTGQLIIATVIGGMGIREYAFDDARVTFEVYDTNVDEASTTARHLYGRVREWHHNQSGVFYRGDILRPVYHPYGGDPGEPSFTPGYWFTVELTFRSEEISGL